MRTSVLSLLILFSWASVADATPQGPPYVDPERNMEKQRVAAAEAVAICRSGSAKEIVPLFVDVSGLVRDLVFEALVDRNDPALLASFEKALGHKDEFVACTVAELYGACKYAAGREALEKFGLKAKSEMATLEAIWALEAIGDAAAGKALEKVHKRRHGASEYRVQGDALIALAAVDPERARPLIEKALGNKRQPALQIAALMALGRIGPKEPIEAAIALTNAKQAPKSQRAWEARVLFTALECFSNWHERAGSKELAGKVIEALILRLGREEALAKHEVGKALTDLTGEPIGDDAQMWQGWWDARKDVFEPKNKVVEKKKKKKKKKKGDKGDEDEKKEPEVATTRVRFHGIPIHSNRMVFAQDISGGMSKFNIYGKKAVEAGKAPEDNPTRMKFSSDELIRVLGKLDDEAMTNVVFFATEYQSTSPKLFPIKKARESLKKFVREKSVTPKGRGLYRSNLYDTLEFVLNDPEIDTVYFLSEGGPSEGRFQRIERFIKHLVRLNSYRRVQVHTLQVSDTKDGLKYLGAIAEATNARYYGLDFLTKAKGS